MADELTERILAGMQRQKDHPELFEITLGCRQCGRLWVSIYPEAEVSRYVQEHSGQKPTLYTLCERCTDDGSEE